MMRAFAGWFYRQPYLLLALTALAWAGNAIAGRLALGEVSPMVVVSVRWVIACAVLLVIARREAVGAWPQLRSRWLFVVAMGTFGFTVFNALYYAAAHHTTAVNMTILQGGMPALVLVGAFLFYGTRISMLQIAGLALTLAGVAAVAAQGSLANLLEFHLNVGDVWILLGMVLYSGYTIGLRNRPQVPGLALFSAFAAVAFLTSLPFLAYEIATGTVQWPTFKGWLVVLFVGLVPSVMAQLSFMRAVELIGPGRAGVFMNLVPVCGALLAVLLLAEPFHLYHAIGLALVLGGIWLAERGRTV